MYRQKESGQYRANYAELCEAFPTTSIPNPPSKSDLDHLGFEEVLDAALPEHDLVLQCVSLSAPAFVNGRWVKTWEIKPVDAATAVDNITAAVQRRLDEFARSRYYDGILSACTYATSAVPQFKSDGQCAVNLRDATWSILYQLMTDVQAGVKTMPSTFAEVEQVLPPLVWPSNWRSA
jgi:hypothetical protein